MISDLPKKKKKIIIIFLNFKGNFYDILSEYVTGGIILFNKQKP